MQKRLQQQVGNESPTHSKGGKGIDDATQGKLETLFHQIDADHDNGISKEELIRGFVKLGLHFSEAKVNEMFSIADADKDGSLCITEFTRFFNHLPELVESAQCKVEHDDNPDSTDGFVTSGCEVTDMMKGLFDILDVDTEAVIEWDELKRGFEKLGYTDGEDKKLVKFFNLADHEDRGSIDFMNFINYFFHLPLELQRVNQKGDLHNLIEIKHFYNKFLKDEADLVDITSLQEGMAASGIDVSKIDTIFAIADRNKDGKIDFEEFVTFFIKLPQLLSHAKFVKKP